MSYKIGIDLVDVKQFKKSVERAKSLKQRLFTKHELEYCKNRPIEHLASRFAAKEAFFKAGNIKNLPWKDVEVKNLKSGKPIINLSKKEKLKYRNIEVSMSHTKENAIALVLIEH